MLITKAKMERDAQLATLLALSEEELAKELMLGFGPFETDLLTKRLAKYDSEVSDQISSILTRNKKQILQEFEMIKITHKKYNDPEIQNTFLAIENELAKLEKSIVIPFQNLEEDIEDLREIDRQCKEAELLLELQDCVAQYNASEKKEDYRLLGRLAH